MKYCLVSLGCQMNTSDTERVSSVLESIGFEHTESEEEATILGLIACSVRQRAIDRAYAKIKKWNSWKNKRNLLTFATGCVLPADMERFLKAFDFFFPINELPNLPDMIAGYGVVTQAGLNLRAVVPPESRGDEKKVSGVLRLRTFPPLKHLCRFRTVATSFAHSARCRIPGDEKFRGPRLRY